MPEAPPPPKSYGVTFSKVAATLAITCVLGFGLCTATGVMSDGSKHANLYQEIAVVCGGLCVLSFVGLALLLVAFIITEIVKAIRK